MYEQRIEVRWRDVDALRHVNNAVYATYLEECRDGWLERVLGEDGALWDYVLARDESTSGARSASTRRRCSRG
jgi:acyl-CoA thioester hydrolase